MTSKKVFVNKFWADPTKRLFQAQGFTIVDTLEDCDIYVLNGGEDIHPKLYKQTIIGGAGVDWLDEERDVQEVEEYNKAKELGKFKFGICRGGQLLNVMNGGKLWQHVDNHNQAHDMTDLETGTTVWTSSVHHQQFIPGPGVVKVAVANIAQYKLGYYNGKKIYEFNAKYGDGDPDVAEDLEVCFYPKDRALCIQGHPEYGGYSQFTGYCMDLIERYYDTQVAA